MTEAPPLRRLIALPGVSDLELKALMKPRMSEEESRADFPEIEACVSALFGLTPDQADEIERPVDWDRIDRKPLAEQVVAFEAAGWDVTDGRRRPLRTLVHFAAPLWLAIRGVAGTLPFQPDAVPTAGDWGSNMAAEAARFRKR
jgi:hypothetical protein